MKSVLESGREAFLKYLADQKVLSFADYRIKQGNRHITVNAASNADQNNRASREISNQVVEELIGHPNSKKLAAQTLGDRFELAVQDYLHSTFLKLDHLRPGKWKVQHVKTREENFINQFEQYSHLDDLLRFCASAPELAAALGNDYGISPDVIISRDPEPDEVIDSREMILSEGVAERCSIRKRVNSSPILHACISCKFTLRSDRSQNARSEALNLLRNRKGRVPHIAVVTAECLPSRLASLALGTGDIDCLYHIALPNLIEAVDPEKFPDAADMLETMLSGKRLRDLSDLPLDLAV